jgi:hypothetical protein
MLTANRNIYKGGPFTEKLTLNVEKNFCEGCSLALRKFTGNMEGIKSIDVDEGKIAVIFDQKKKTRGT